MFNKMTAGLFFILFLPIGFANSLNIEKYETKKLHDLISPEQLMMVGEAKFSFIFWDVYTSQLSTSSGQYSANSKDDIVLYEINYLMNITSKDLIQNTIEQWQHLGLQEVTYSTYVEQLKYLWPDIKKGDSLSLLVNKNESLFFLNKAFIGLIDKPEFGPVFLDIWLSEKTSQPELRSHLLGTHN